VIGTKTLPKEIKKYPRTLFGEKIFLKNAPQIIQEVIKKKREIIPGGGPSKTIPLKFFSE